MKSLTQTYPTVLFKPLNGENQGIA